MKNMLGVAVLLGTAVAAVSVIGAIQAADQQLQQPAWAYGVPPPPAPGATPPAPARDDGKIFTLSGTDKKFTFNQIRGRRDNDTPARIGPADWYPEDHPAMPKIVAEGDDSRGIIACSLCHYPNGKGRSENASPPGLPKQYICRQLHDTPAVMRPAAGRRHGNSHAMVRSRQARTDDDIAA